MYMYVRIPLRFQLGGCRVIFTRVRVDLTNVLVVNHRLQAIVSQRQSTPGLLLAAVIWLIMLTLLVTALAAGGRPVDRYTPFWGAYAMPSGGGTSNPYVGNGDIGAVFGALVTGGEFYITMMLAC